MLLLGFFILTIWYLVLGLNGASVARRLVRLLLADPLTEKQSWEDVIDSRGTDESRGLLIRYVLYNMFIGGKKSGLLMILRTGTAKIPVSSTMAPVLRFPYHHQS